MSPSIRERFILLDGLRGIAALFIIHRHAENLFGNAPPSSYLAVDLFFGLSGFVLAHAYASKLQSDKISPAQFMKARLFRLYPLYGLALALMVAYFATLYVLGKPTPIDDLHRNIDLGELAFATITGILFIPAPFTLTLNGALFMISPAWSLFNEIVANFVYANWGVRASARKLMAVIALSACLLVVAAIEFGRLHAGFRWNEMYAGMARVFFSFFAGVLIYKFRDKVPKLRPWLAVTCLLMVAVILGFPTPDDARPYFDLFAVLLVWPALLYVASRTVPGPIASAISTFLGTASYGVYVLHIPLLAWAELLVPGMTGEGVAVFSGIAMMIIITVVSWYLTVAFDEPLQKWFKRRAFAPVAAMAPRAEP